VIHLRIVAPADLVEPTLDLLTGSTSDANVAHLPGTSLKPSGDVVLCDIAREDASILLADLCDLGLAESGTIAVEEIDTSISAVARQAESAAAGAVADAVV
jgi:hypothetical protein